MGIHGDQQIQLAVVTSSLKHRLNNILLRAEEVVTVLRPMWAPNTMVPSTFKWKCHKKQIKSFILTIDPWFQAQPPLLQFALQVPCWVLLTAEQPTSNMAALGRAWVV